MKKGFITDQLAQDVKNKADELIKLGPIAEMFDGLIIGVSINFLDDNFGDQIPESIQQAITLVLEAFAYEQYDKLDGAAVTLIDDLVDLPFNDKDKTAQFITLLIQLIRNLVVRFAKKHL